MRVLILLLLLLSPLHAETVQLNAQPGLLELRIVAPENASDADVSWESRQPLDLDYRVYENRSVFITYAKAGQQLIISSDVINWEARKRDKRTWIIQVEGEPEPPTPPTPPTPPEPPVPPEPDAPFPTPGFTVLVLTEAGQVGALPPSQAAILSSPKVIQYLRDKCIQLDGQPAVRIWDDDYSDQQLRFAPPVLASAYRDVLGKAVGQLPWIAISDGKTGWQGPLPMTIDETMELLKKYGG